MIEALFYVARFGSGLNPHECDGRGFQVLSALLSLRLSASNYNKHTDNEANLPATG